MGMARHGVATGSFWAIPMSFRRYLESQLPEMVFLGTSGRFSLFPSSYQRWFKRNGFADFPCCRRPESGFIWLVASKFHRRTVLWGESDLAEQIITPTFRSSTLFGLHFFWANPIFCWVPVKQAQPRRHLLQTVAGRSHWRLLELGITWQLALLLVQFLDKVSLTKLVVKVAKNWWYKKCNMISISD